MSASMTARSVSCIPPAAARQSWWRACAKNTGAAATTARGGSLRQTSLARRFYFLGQLEHRHRVKIAVVVARDDLEVIERQPELLASLHREIDQACGLIRREIHAWHHTHRRPFSQAARHPDFAETDFVADLRAHRDRFAPDPAIASQIVRHAAYRILVFAQQINLVIAVEVH